MRNHPGNLPAAAFTLIETLSAIGIIAVLVGLLLPALGRAREVGRGASCAASLHGAALAMTMYLDQNEGSFWPYYEDYKAPNKGRRWWFGYEENGPPANALQRNRPLDRSRGFLSAFMAGEASDLSCSAFPYGTGNYFPKFSPKAGAFGYNTAALAGQDPYSTTGNRLKRLNELIGRLSDVFALADGIHFDRLDYSSSPPLKQGFNEPAYIQWQKPSTFGGNAGVNGGYAHYRHAGRANVLFLDAHVGIQRQRGVVHPYSRMGIGPIGNLTDDQGRMRDVKRGSVVEKIDLIYGL
jgi:prepilin-type processing-associated H-X9-DG protein